MNHFDLHDAEGAALRSGNDAHLALTELAIVALRANVGRSSILLTPVKASPDTLAVAVLADVLGLLQGIAEGDEVSQVFGELYDHLERRLASYVPHVFPPRQLYGMAFQLSDSLPPTVAELRSPNGDVIRIENIGG